MNACVRERSGWRARTTADERTHGLKLLVLLLWGEPLAK
jgi:hypothetical protein